MNEMKTLRPVIVTGAAGFIGSHLSAALLESGATVTGIDCFTDYYARPLKEANLWTEQFRRSWEAQFEALDSLLDEMKSAEKSRARRP